MEIRGVGNVKRSFVDPTIWKMVKKRQRRENSTTRYVVLRLYLIIVQEGIIAIAKKDSCQIDMKQRFIVSLLIFLAVLFVVTKYRNSSKEGFAIPNGHCGVDLAPCPAGTRCMNGYCLSESPPTQQAKTDFIILP